MYFSEEELKETYSKFRDEDLIRIAEQDAAALTPEALQVLKGEIARRGLQYEDPSKPLFLILEKSLLDSYCDSIQNSFCPNCGTQGNLNRIEVETVFGIGHFYGYDRERLILCKKCTNAVVFKKCAYSILLGIWTVFPIFITLLKNINALRIFKLSEPSESLVEFVKANYQEIEPIRRDPLAISYFINGTNNWSS
jgi:hypothetical protein